MNSNNNFLNTNFFQSTPQKDDKSKGWIVPSGPAPSFGAQSTQQGFPNTSPVLNNTRIFGQAPGVPAFGMNAPQGAGSSPAGQGMSTFTPPVPGAFGSGTPAPTNFGSTSGVFGAPSNALGAFGGTQGIFGNTANTFGPGSWNSGTSSSAPTPWSISAKGSKAVPYSLTRIKEDTGVFSDLVDITGMKEYSSKSVDEIRKEDYETFTPPKPSGFGTSFGQPAPGLQSVGQPNAVTGMPPNANSTPFPSGSSGLFGTPATSMGFGTSPSQGFGSGSGNIGQTTGIAQAPGTSGLGLASPFSSGFGASKPLSSPSTGTSNIFNTASTPGVGMQTSQPFFPPPQAPMGNTLSNITPQPANQFGASSSGIGTPSLFGSKPSTTVSDSTLITPPSLNAQLPKPQPSTAPFGSTQNLFSGASQAGNLFGTSSGGQTVSHPPSQSINPFGTVQTMPCFNPFPSTAGMATSTFTPSFSSPFQQQISSSLTGQPSQTAVDMSDPYMIKDVKFEKVQQQKPSIKVALPVPIFSTKKDVPEVDLKIRPPNPILRSSIYTIPDLNDVDTSRPIPNLVIGFEGKGRIEYLEPVTVKSLESIEKKVIFRNENVEINDPIGTGLNKKARVYLEGLFPVSRTTNEIIKGRQEQFPQKGIQERFIYQLKNDSSKKFIDYDVDNGIYISEVNHF